MFNKIDKNLLKGVHSFDKNTLVKVIVYSSNLKKLKSILEYGYFEFPFLSCVSTSVKYGDLVKLSSLGFVNYISKESSVCSLIYNSKKFIKTEKLDVFLSNDIENTCCVIDTGIYPHIDFLLGKNRVIRFVDLINYRNNMYDDNGHGTFVSGIICANSITNIYDGIDNSLNLIMIKALDKNGETTSSKILEAMQWVMDNKNKYNIKMVCMSFGSIFDNPLDPLVRGAEVLWDNGIVVVSAGGNSGPDSATIMSPGASKKIITVGSLNDLKGDLSVADFSSRGPINNAYKPDCLLPGVNIISTSIFDKNKNFYTTMSGTSVSTPMLIGVVSLLLKINPKYTPNEIKYMVINSCVKLNGDRNSEGYGYLDLSKLVLLKK